MRRLLIAFLLFLLCPGVKAQFQGLIVNEFSQGDQGNREYIEFLVSGIRTCTDSSADLRGWLFDDQNGWYGTTASAMGHYRFKNVSTWSAVPFGSIILIYNSAANEKNLSITLADDPNDANHDYTYVLPINSSSYLEQNLAEPGSTSGLTYSYPSSASTLNYTGSTSQWQFIIALSNGGDVISTISPTRRDSAFFSIGYNYEITAPYRNPTVSIGPAGSGKNCYLNNSNYDLISSWAIGNADPLNGSINETPGLPNGGANTTWITSMRLPPPPILATNITVCIAAGQSYTFGGMSLSSTGCYSHVFSTARGCDSTVNLYLVVSSIQNHSLAGCGSVSFNNVTYTSSTILRDTIRSAITNCDSIIHSTAITIYAASPSASIHVCLSQGQTYNFNGTVLNSTGHYTTHFSNANGCDSTVNLYLLITQSQAIDLYGCGSVFYKGNTYTSSTTLDETVPSSVTGCDSVLRTVNIIVKPKPVITISPDKTVCVRTPVTLTASSNDAAWINWQGIGTGSSITVTPFVSTGYTAVVTSTNGCTNSATVMITIQDFTLSLSVDPNPVIAGTTVHLRTNAASSYQVLSWQPAPFFSNPNALIQNLTPDSSINIMVAARSATGCIDTATAIVAVDPLVGIFLPSAFTPNSDGRNDVFRVLGGNIKELHLRIYNRWGQMIFDSHERSKGWDGSFAGKPQIAGTYVYVVRAVLKNGMVINKKGTLLLVR